MVRRPLFSASCAAFVRHIAALELMGHKLLTPGPGAPTMEKMNRFNFLDEQCFALS